MESRRIPGNVQRTDGAIMSESGQLANARKNTLKDNDNQFDMYLYCGGGGAGYFPPPAGVPGIVLEYRISKLIVRNMLIVLQNTLDGYGIQMYTDAGGTIPKTVAIGLSDSPLDDLQTTAEASGVTISGGSAAYGEIYEFPEALDPQPFLRPWEGKGPNPDWDSRVYVYLWWGSSSYYNYGNPLGQSAGGPVVDERAFKIIKHDNEIKA